MNYSLLCGFLQKSFCPRLAKTQKLTIQDLTPFPPFPLQLLPLVKGRPGGVRHRTAKTLPSPNKEERIFSRTQGTDFSETVSFKPVSFVLNELQPLMRLFAKIILSPAYEDTKTYNSRPDPSFLSLHVDQ